MVDPSTLDHRQQTRPMAPKEFKMSDFSDLPFLKTQKCQIVPDVPFIFIIIYLMFLYSSPPHFINFNLLLHANCGAPPILKKLLLNS